MKRLVIITIAALLFAACKKDETAPQQQPLPDPTPTVALAGTSWVGTYDDNYHGYPATLTWSIDFLTDSTGTLHFEGVIAAQPQPSFDIPFSYTFDGTEGAVHTTNMTGSVNFTYDTTNNTITWELAVSDGNTSLGGVTTFYLQDEQPDVFPVNTSWVTKQQLTVSDTLMSVEWGLDFWVYGWGGQVNYCAGNICSGTSFLWQYDSTAHSGHITINSATHPFTYDPATEILTLEYSAKVYGTNITIGGTLLFHRKNGTESNGAIHKRIDNTHFKGNIIFSLAL